MQLRHFCSAAEGPKQGRSLACYTVIITVLSGQSLQGEIWSVMLHVALLRICANDIGMTGSLVPCCPAAVHAIPLACNRAEISIVISLQMLQKQHHKFLSNAQLCSGIAAERRDCCGRPWQANCIQQSTALGMVCPPGIPVKVRLLAATW